MSDGMTPERRYKYIQTHDSYIYIKRQPREYTLKSFIPNRLSSFSSLVLIC